MSKTFTVKEVAAALGITPRGVIQRLNRNQLKGARKTNQYGSQEWRVYATKEISQAVESLRNADGSQAPEQASFAPPETDEDYIDAESVEPVEETQWLDFERKRLEILAETLVKPLTEQVMVQAAALREKELQLEQKELELEDKDRQLRLLPDFQKRAEDEGRAAEAERKAAEERALEIIALKKQISALESVKIEAQAKVEKADLEVHRVREYKEAQAKELEEENEKLKQQVEESSLSAQKLSDLEKIVLELQKPKQGFWRKFFGVGTTNPKSR